MKNSVNFAYIIVCMFICFLSPLTYAEVSASLSSKQIYLGDDIKLMINSSTDSQSSPDLTLLEKDFLIKNQLTSSNISIINGRRSFNKRWTLLLQPKQSSVGKVTIPKITLGGETTQEIQFEILDVPKDVKADLDNHVFIEAYIDNFTQQFYPQQQIPFTVKFYYDDLLQEGELSPLTIDNALVEKLTADRTTREARFGKTYRVTTRRYVISPEKSGKFTIPTITATGRLVSQQQAQNYKKKHGDTNFMNRFFEQTPFGNDPFLSDIFQHGAFNNSQLRTFPFNISSDPINIDIKPAPSSFTGKNWLPAESLELIDSWVTSPPQLSVGEPVTRVLKLRARGLAGSQIPHFIFPTPKGFKLYQDSPTSETVTDGKQIYGDHKVQLTYIPKHTGKVKIPEITIDWWNTLTNKQEQLKSSPWELFVEKGSNEDGGNHDNNLTNDVSSKASEEKQAISETGESRSLTPTDGQQTLLNTSLWKIALFTFALGLLSFFTFHSLKGRRDTKVSHLDKTYANDLQEQFELACANNKPKDVAKALLALAKAKWPKDQPTNLNEIAQRVEFGAKEVIELNNTIYSGNNVYWKGHALKRALASGLTDKELLTDNQDEGLKLRPLYPK